MTESNRDHASGWIVRLTAEPALVVRIADELSGGPFQVAFAGETLYLSSHELNRNHSPAHAEWDAFDLVKLIAAGADLMLGVPIASPHWSLEGETGQWPPHSSMRVNDSKPGGQHGKGLRLLDILQAARESQFIRRALFARVDGTAAGLYEAYEAIQQEIMGYIDYDADMDSAEWIIAQGWTTEDEEERFRLTLQYYKGDNRSSLPARPISPEEADLFMRRVLGGFISLYMLTSLRIN